MIAGSNANSSASGLTNISVISCIPEYWFAVGPTILTLRQGIDPLVPSFQNLTPWQEYTHAYANQFEADLVRNTLFDSSNSFLANLFGRLVYEYANIVNEPDLLDSQTLKDGLESLFTSIHATMVSRVLFVPISTTEWQGILLQPITKLYVVENIAIAIIVLMFVIFLTTI